MPDRSAGEINWLLEEMLPAHVDLDDGSPREYVCLIVQEGDNGQNKRMKLEAMLWRGDGVVPAFCLLAAVLPPLCHPQDDLLGRTCSQDCPAHQPARFCSIFCLFKG